MEFLVHSKRVKEANEAIKVLDKGKKKQTEKRAFISLGLSQSQGLIHITPIHMFASP
jgi:hypothetical protein